MAGRDIKSITPSFGVIRRNSGRFRRDKESSFVKDDGKAVAAFAGLCAISSSEVVCMTIIVACFHN